VGEKGTVTVRIHHDDLVRFLTDAVAAMGSPRAHAAAVAEHLAGANLCGHDSHGVIRLKQYRDHVREGRIDPAAEPRVLIDRPSTALLDGNRAWGQVAAGRAMDVAIEKARRSSVSAVSVRGAYHIGRAGVYALEAARRGFIAQLWCNGHGIARVAPWGGLDARLATNPIAIAVPATGQPVLVDITTSVVAEGKVRLARDAGKPIPEGWVLDARGAPATDPAALYAGGTLLPLGGREGHKGYGLSLVVDLLGGILSGAGAGLMTREVGNGLFIQATDPEAFGPREEILERIEEFLRYVRSARPAPGVAEILLPGEPEARIEAERRRDGIPIPGPIWAEATAVARELGVEAPAVT
jgi:uncharacterized oxidoreductase